ncbi:hypothetical protein HYFRA_00013977 [Hymenoscyphus fraxineus]|uniref:BTB domain-containing protein n=1 Tax=Hymenoscyphus fraxineus TaxID=746836 RepID=A0A9N9LB40_9HELO|nr:hypothetical protein HYFRA_00013977 [Hymenoscyphus fraxineus]
MDTEFNDAISIVTFKVGSKGAHEKFHVHKEVACNNSPVFAAAFNGNFAEGGTLEYTLDDIEPAIFKLLMKWINTTRESYLKQCKDKADPIHEDYKNHFLYKENLLLVKLWILGERLLMPALQNAAIDALEEIVNNAFYTLSHHYKYVYEHTLPGSALRRYVVEQLIVYFVAEDWLENLRTHFPPDMLFDIFKSYKTRFPLLRSKDHPPNQTLINTKEFHVPVEGVNQGKEAS